VAFLARVENGHSGSERDFRFTFVESFALQLHCAHHRFIRDAKLQVAALDGV
jgi:hypothetical protein